MRRRDRGRRGGGKETRRKSERRRSQGGGGWTEQGERFRSGGLLVRDDTSEEPRTGDMMSLLPRRAVFLLLFLLLQHGCSLQKMPVSSYNIKSGISPLCPINKTMAWDRAARQDALRRFWNDTFDFLATGVSVWRFQSLWEIWCFLKRLHTWGLMNTGSFFAASFSGSGFDIRSSSVSSRRRSADTSWPLPFWPTPLSKPSAAPFLNTPKVCSWVCCSSFPLVQSRSARSVIAGVHLLCTWHLCYVISFGSGFVKVGNGID